MSSRRLPLSYFGLAVAVLLAAIPTLRLLAGADWNPTITIKFGEQFPEQNRWAEDLLGEIVVAPQAGHDGKFFFTQAVDPFYLEPDVNAVHLDSPSYRAQRMAYPTLAGLGGLLPAKAVAWGLIVVNWLALALGTGFTAAVAMRMGLSAWYGLAFTLNPGVVVSMNIDSAGVLALAGLMAAVLFVMKDSLPSATAALVIASLTRETMLIGALGLALYWYYRKRRVPWALATPFVVTGLWWIYVHWRLEEGVGPEPQALAAPLVGFVRAFSGWLEAPGALPDMVIGVVLLFVSVALLIRTVRSPTALGSAVAGFALLGIMLSQPVWGRYFDSSRALAPVLTAYILLASASIKADRRLSSRRRVTVP